MFFGLLQVAQVTVHLNKVVAKVVISRCNINMPKYRAQLFQIYSEGTLVVLFDLLQVTQVIVQPSQVVISRCNIKMLMAQLFQTHSEGTLVVLFGLLQVTQVIVQSSQVVISRCNLNMLRAQLFQTYSEA